MEKWEWDGAVAENPANQTLSCPARLSLASELRVATSKCRAKQARPAGGICAFQCCDGPARQLNVYFFLPYFFSLSSAHQNTVHASTFTPRYRLQ